MGGEITWTCLPNGQFQFTVKIYLDCNGNVNIDVSNGIEVNNYPVVGSPSLNLPLTIVSQRDISNGCYYCDNPGGNPGVVKEYIFKTNPVTLSGTPPAQGWIISFDGCCRNAAVTNIINAGNEGFALRAKMFSYNGNNTGYCYDSSPEFAEKPAMISCAANATTYNQYAFDKELDSLSYSWAGALDDFFGAWTNTNPPPLNYVTGYSPTSPLPGTVQNPSNQPANINPATGAVSFLSYTTGNFATVIKVEAWKCNTLVAEIYREMVMSIIPCTTTPTPVVTAPFQDINGNYTLYTDTVMAGELVSFTITGTDNGTIIVDANGSEFGTNDTIATSGCPYPPCATLSASLPDTGSGTVSTVFNWQTDCNHVALNESCTPLSTSYFFSFNFRDDNCPVSAETTALVTIVIIGDSVVASPLLHCASVLQNGDVLLNWSPSVNTGNTFNSYHIYHSESADGPFTVIDSIFDINTSSYTHAGANADDASQFYFIKTRSGCAGKIYNIPVDTLSSIFPIIIYPGNGIANLHWHALSEPLPSSVLNGFYKIYRLQPGESWTLIDSTQELNYHDTVIVCNDSIYYRIELEDSSGCISVSAVPGDIVLLDNVVADFGFSLLNGMDYAFGNYSENSLYNIWYFGDGTSSNAFSATHTYNDTGQYVVTLIAWNACDSDTLILPLTVTSINETEAIYNCVIYPNPASSFITVAVSSGLASGESSSSKYEVKIFNAQGQLVTLSVVEGLQSSIINQKSTIDISTLSKGIYFLSLDDGEGRMNGKFVKE